jgi:hypothetical protein
VFGAGVDLIYNVPTMTTLLREMADFAKGEGLPVHQALRKKMPSMQFTFDKYAEDQSDVMLRQLFSSDNQELVKILRLTAGQLEGGDGAASVAPVIERLCSLAESNQLSGEQAVGVARFAGSELDLGGGAAVLDPNHVVLTPTVAQALRQAFVQAMQGNVFTTAQRSQVEYFVDAVSNVEELMSLYFMMYSLGQPREQKKYLYIVWMLWAFLRLRSFNRPIQPESIYQKLPSLAGDVITFNYTNFFDSRAAKAVCYFHGRLTEYLELDSREVITDNALFRAATSVEGVVRLIDALRLDVAADPQIDVPSIVPPTKFKPVMSRRQLLTWARADELICQAGTIVVVGYSFALADEHFNDLLRHSNGRTRIIVVNPDVNTASREVGRIFGLESDSFTEDTRAGFEIKRAELLICVSARAEHVSEDFLTAIV